MDIERLPLTTQTLYAELRERLMAQEMMRSMGHLSGCITTKKIKGETYYYYQYNDPVKGQRQAYLGKKNTELEKVIARLEKERETVQHLDEGIHQLCAQIRVGRALMTDPPSAKILKALSDAGFFHLQGVLVGTHAFIVLGNILGIRWQNSGVRTQDIDLAGEPHLQISLPEIQADVPKILESLKMGFSPIPALDRKHPSTSFSVRGQDLRVDFLTPELGTPKNRPIFMKRFNVSAQPLRFLDYLMEKPLQGVVINGGGVLVNVPEPARFALHKMMTSQERNVSQQTKAEKDLFQATQLINVLCDDRPGDLQLAWQELAARGSGWVGRVKKGINWMKKRYPEVYQKAIAALPSLV